MNDKDKEKIYNILKDIPLETVDYSITEGTLVLEGGAFRGLYQEGVLDCLLDNGYNFRTIIGVSAGALNGVNYMTRQRGRSAHVNIRYRHDGRYVGANAFLKSRGKCLIDFDFAFGKLPDVDDLNIEALKDQDRKFIAVATDLTTGKATYFENNRDDFIQCVKASATLPYLSKPVIIDDKPYLDGGCDDRIPYKWAMNQGYKKIIVIRTRDRDFRIKPNYKRRYLITKRWYSSYKDFAYILSRTDTDYNKQCDELFKLENNNELFVIAPSKPINIKMLEGDLNKLKDLYFLGYNDCKNNLDMLKRFLKKN